MERLTLWSVYVNRNGRPHYLGQVAESSESGARCAAVCRFGISDEEARATGRMLPREGIYSLDDFEVTEVR